MPDTLLRDCLYWQRYSAMRALAARQNLFNHLLDIPAVDTSWYSQALKYQRLSEEGAKEARAHLFAILERKNG